MRNRVLWVSLMGAVGAGGWVAAAPREAAAKEAKVRFEGRQPTGGGSYTLRFSLETTTSSPGWVAAYLPGPDQPDPATPIQPLYRIELLRDGKWADHFLGWCGTGLGNVKMTPGKKRFFTVAVPPGEWQAMRTGLRLVSTSGKPEESRTVWSEPVPRSTLPPRPKPQ